MILLPAETLGRKQNHEDSLSRKPCFMDNSLGKEARDCGESRQKPDMMGSLGRKRKLVD